MTTDPQTYTLSQPVDLGDGSQVATVKIRPVTVADVIAAQRFGKKNDDVETALAAGLIASVCALPIPAVNGLSLKDMAAIMELIGGEDFFIPSR